MAKGYFIRVWKDEQTKRASFLLDRCVWMDNQIDTLKRTIEHVKMAAISVGTVK